MTNAYSLLGCSNREILLNIPSGIPSGAGTSAAGRAGSCGLISATEMNVTSCSAGTSPGFSTTTPATDVVRTGSFSSVKTREKIMGTFGRLAVLQSIKGIRNEKSYGASYAVESHLETYSTNEQ